MGRLLAAVVLIGLAFAVASGAVERLMLYPFDPTRSPAPAGLTETKLATPDGETLVLWSARPATGKPTLLYFSGNAGNLASRAGRFAAFLKRGYGLVAPGYRGGSGSTGRASETTLSADAALVAEALPRLVGRGQVVYYGESLGAAVAIALAADHPPAAMVLEAPFASVADMAEATYGTRALARLVKSRWPSAERIAQVTAPLLVLHGEADPLVPLAQGRAVFDAAGSADKTLYVVPGAGHVDVWQIAAQRALYRFLDRF